VHVLQYFRAAATDDGHIAAGHGQHHAPTLSHDGLDTPLRTVR
jgi:hypothetical protein